MTNASLSSASSNRERLKIDRREHPGNLGIRVAMPPAHCVGRCLLLPDGLPIARVPAARAYLPHGLLGVRTNRLEGFVNRSAGGERVEDPSIPVLFFFQVGRKESAQPRVGIGADEGS